MVLRCAVLLCSQGCSRCTVAGTCTDPGLWSASASASRANSTAPSCCGCLLPNRLALLDLSCSTNSVYLLYLCCTSLLPSCDKGKGLGKV